MPPCLHASMPPCPMHIKFPTFAIILTNQPWNLNLPNRTELSELGEFGLIDLLTKNISLENKSSLYGVGDDAAVIDNKGKLTLVSTDLLVEGVHFDLSYTPLRHLGYKAAVVNISDIVAMNGTARQLLVGLSVSNRFPVEALEELYAGIRQACKVYHVDLVGGDTTSSVRGIVSFHHGYRRCGSGRCRLPQYSPGK